MEDNSFWLEFQVLREGPLLFIFSEAETGAEQEEEEEDDDDENEEGTIEEENLRQRAERDIPIRS